MIVSQPFVIVLSNVTTEPKESILHEDASRCQDRTENQRAVIPQRHANPATRDPVRLHEGPRGDMANGGLSTPDKDQAFSASPESEAASRCRFQWEDSGGGGEFLVGEVAFAERVDMRP